MTDLLILLAILLLTLIELIPTSCRTHCGQNSLFQRVAGSALARLAGRPPTLSSLLLFSGRVPRKVGKIQRMWPPKANPMFRKRFLVEVLGLAKKFHIFVGFNSDKELRVSLEEAEVGDVLDKATFCPRKRNCIEVNVHHEFDLI